MGGSFYDAVPPGYAAYILKAVLNSFDETTRLAILRQVRTVCTADTRLLVLEDVIGPPNEDLYTKMLDLAMLLRTGGAQYPKQAWAALFAAGGFRLARITPSPLGPACSKACRSKSETQTRWAAPCRTRHWSRRLQPTAFGAAHRQRSAYL
jgi:O-methyltransferase